MKFHCLHKWELQDRDGTACLIKRTLPFQASTERLNVSAQACEKSRAAAPRKCQEVETVNGQQRPLTEITPPLYNPVPRLYGGQEVSGADPDVTGLPYCSMAFSVCVCVCAVVHTVNADRYSFCTLLLSHPLCICLSRPITNQHSAGREPDNQSEATALTCSASRSPLARQHGFPEHLRSHQRCFCSIQLSHIRDQHRFPLSTPVPVNQTLSLCSYRNFITPHTHRPSLY